jgi:isoleucyl-tRNA synthetase
MSQNYKGTLNLPRTDFPMKANLTMREPELLKRWNETRLYETQNYDKIDNHWFCTIERGAHVDVAVGERRAI